MTSGPRRLAHTLAARFVDVDRTGSRRVLTRDGGYFERTRGAGAPFELVASPVIGATSACTDGEDHWVTSSLGILWRERGGAWSPRALPELEGARDARVIADAGRVWLAIGERLYEVRADRLAPCGLARVGRLVRARGTLHVVTHEMVSTFWRGRLLPLVDRRALRGGDRFFVTIGEADEGGLHVVDDGAGLHRWAHGTLTCVRQGSVTVELRHRYLDDDADVRSTAVRYAEVAPDGTVAARRAEDEITIFHPSGATRRCSRGAGLVVIDAKTPAFFDAATPLASPTFVRLTDAGAELDVAGTRIETVLPRSGPSSTEWRLWIDRPGERWSIAGSRLVLESPGVPPHHVDLAVGLIGLAAPPGSEPVLLDRLGRHHVLRGARFETVDAGGAPESPVVDARILAGRSRVLRAERVEDVELPAPEPLGSALLGGDGSALQERLNEGARAFVVIRVAVEAERAARMLARWTPLPRTAAHMFLATLLGDDEDVPGPEESDAIADTVMASLPPRTAFFARDASGLAMVEDRATWLVCVGPAEAEVRRDVALDARGAG